MTVPAKILEVVKRFDDNADDYRAAHHGETWTRIGFINPFFDCLGWDIDNRHGATEKYKDVIHEAAIKIGGAVKAPDYSTQVTLGPSQFASNALLLRDILSHTSHVQRDELAWLPVRVPDPDNPTDQSRHTRMVSLVVQMLTLHLQAKGAKTADEEARFQRQINPTDRRIDRLVYELYGLTDEETGIVEQSKS
jgi:hypothetical protein